jgi:CheY-like chemotaxis protein
MPDGGVLSLRAGNVRADAARAEGLPPGDYVRLSVEDNGTGMDPETLSRALEPFFTTKPIGKGTGLGLAMVQGFIRQSGGDIRIASVPGRGTSVSLWLPRAVHAEAPGASGQPQVGPAPRGQRHVLVVDDEPSICRMLTLSLTKAGFQAIARESGELALEYLRGGGACDLLISDQSMPDLTGSELIEQATRLRPDLATMLITGHDLTSDVDRLGGQVTVLRKPFRQEVLLDQVKSLLNKARIDVGVTGKRSIRTRPPSAASTAEAIAAPAAVMPPSPAPFTPNGFSGVGASSRNSTSTTGSSLMVGIR